ncbi:unnamed protein product [Oppiella nova]|uniref:Uncharacterized protein n=1 Tax=Oppiella nova TaxID=334625 RepID=A0A7R9QPI6_9ACAR|nr:unnamed protein product [Oppiella nova]CAG2170865.1 unnamed protein product [Oppiella nova]
MALRISYNTCRNHYNPFIYCWLNENFKRRLKTLVICFTVSTNDDNSRPLDSSVRSYGTRSTHLARNNSTGSVTQTVCMSTKANDNTETIL